MNINDIIFILDNIQNGLSYLSNELNVDRTKIKRILYNLRHYNENKLYKKIVLDNDLQDKIKNIPIRNGGKCYFEEDEKERRLKISSTMKKNKKSGGFRIGSGVGKKGWYKGYWSDSSYELAWIIFNIEHNIKFERNLERFPYEYENEIHYYIPDFKIDTDYVEIKGYINNKMKYKIKNFPYNLKILMLNDIKKEIDYVVSKYGKNFCEIYDNKNFSLRYCECGNVLWQKNKSGYCKKCLNETNKKTPNKTKIRQINEKYFCKKCGIKIRKNLTGYCKKCYNRPTKFDINKEKLLDLINIYPYTEICKMYNISSPTIKKKMKKFNIEVKNRNGYWQKLNSEKYKNNKPKKYCNCGNEIKKEKSKMCAKCSRKINLKYQKN